MPMNAQLTNAIPAQAGPVLEESAIRNSALTVIETEARAINALQQRVNGSFLQACQLMFQCQGRVVVIGIGKSGHIARKIAATLASTGTPSFFVHPAEASHGDLGMITQKDVVLSLSNSGETDELLTILPLIKRQNVPLIAMTGNEFSTLAKLADVHLDVSVSEEACPLGLAPTASTTAALVMGDALAIALLEARGFTSEDFARSHPAGSLGRRLLVHISDIMHRGKQIPVVDQNASLTTALVEMTRTGQVGKARATDADLARTAAARYAPEWVKEVGDMVPLGFITNPEQVGGYPNYQGRPYDDADRDGLPDDWEQTHGLDPRNPNDATTDLNGDGYSNIEDFINGLDPRAAKVDWTDTKNNRDRMMDGI